MDNIPSIFGMGGPKTTAEKKQVATLINDEQGFFPRANICFFPSSIGVDANDPATTEC
jgi:hypothetical protein